MLCAEKGTAYFLSIYQLDVSSGHVDLATAVQAGAKSHLPLDSFNFQQAFNTEGQAQLIVVTGQGNDAHLTQARLISFNETLNRLTRGTSPAPLLRHSQ